MFLPRAIQKYLHIILLHWLLNIVTQTAFIPIPFHSKRGSPRVLGYPVWLFTLSHAISNNKSCIDISITMIVGSKFDPIQSSLTRMVDFNSCVSAHCTTPKVLMVICRQNWLLYPSHGTQGSKQNTVSIYIPWIYSTFVKHEVMGHIIRDAHGA